MKRLNIHITELIYIICYLIFLVGSSLALLEHGSELSLWLMTLPVAISTASTILPWFGIRWLLLKMKGCLAGNWVSRVIQVGSLGTFIYAMYLRLYRNLPNFYTLIVVTTLLWAVWLLIMLLSRRGCQHVAGNDKLIE